MKMNGVSFCLSVIISVAHVCRGRGRKYRYICVIIHMGCRFSAILFYLPLHKFREKKRSSWVQILPGAKCFSFK